MQLTIAAKLAIRYAVTTLSASLLLCLLGLFGSTTIFANNLSPQQSLTHPNGEIKANILQALNKSSLILKDDIKELYTLHDFNLIWSNEGKYNDNAYELFSFIENANHVGLDPSHYDLDVIQYFLESTIHDEKILANSDVTFTHAYVKIATHLYKGKLLDEHPIKSDENIFIDILHEAVNKNAITIALENLQPSHEGYAKLVTALSYYRSLEENSGQIKLPKKSLSIGDHSSEIPKLRKRLYTFGDYSGENLTNELLDEPLALAISNFQERHGLEVDGILGRKTVSEINKPISYRIKQLELNLERARQLQTNNKGRYLKVNIPEYKLYLVDNGKTVYQSRVVVGKKKNKTPVLTSELTQLVLSPYWHVPKSIARKEIIPKIQQDPGYLYRNNIKLLGRFNNQTKFVNPETIDWFNIDLTNTPIRFRQEPGAKNSLGRIKFIFPNNYSVYLHDTPSRNLFAKNQRAFSHGCIRVEDPFGLAEVLLADQDAWSKNELSDLANRKKPKALKLSKPIPIYITYMTAWVDDQNIINFRPDIYKRDRKYASNLYNIAH